MTHLFISWIQFVGLILSLIGFFYVSMGLFEDPQTMINTQTQTLNKMPIVVLLFRPLLPVTLFLVLFILIMNFISTPTINKIILGILCVILGFIYIYRFQTRSIEEFFKELKSEDSRIVYMESIAIAVYIVLRIILYIIIFFGLF